MFREMTFGQYYHSDSLIHRLDPRVKLAGTLVYAVSLFFPKNLPGLLCSAAFLLLVIRASRVPLRMMVRGVKPLLILIIFSALINMFTVRGRVILTLWRFNLTEEGLWMAFFLVVRLVFLVAGTSVMTYTTTPSRLTAGLEQSLGFLNRVRIPVHEIAMMMTIALRFIPILTRELDQIMKAQMSRGASFDEGNLIRRARQTVPVLIPLFVSSIRKASDLALAMEARGYHGGEGRTRMYPLSYERKDHAAYLLLALYLILMILCAAWFA